MEVSNSQNARVYIRVGDIEIDISGEQQEVDTHLMKIIRRRVIDCINKNTFKRETAIAAAIQAAKKWFTKSWRIQTLIESCNISKSLTEFWPLFII